MQAQDIIKIGIYFYICYKPLGHEISSLFTLYVGAAFYRQLF
jgi:hypothetical protein